MRINLEFIKVFFLAVLIGAMVTIVHCDGTYPSDQPRQIGSDYYVAIGEKTAAGTQEVIAPVSSGHAIVIRQIIHQVSTGGKIYWMQYGSNPAHVATLASTYYVGCPETLANNGKFERGPNWNLKLEDAYGLYLYNAADPNEGWYEVIYDVVKAS